MRMMMLLAAVLAAAPTKATQSGTAQDFAPGSVTLTDLGPVTDFEPAAVTPPSGPIVGTGAGDIINVGLRLWDIIQANKPVVDIKTVFAAALPKEARHWSELTGWKPPQGRRFGVLMKNLAGMEVVNAEVILWRTTHGRYKGKGRYLTNVTVEPVKVHVLWGYTLDMNAAIPAPVNVGTGTNPVAALTVRLNYAVKSTVKEDRGGWVFYLTGEGKFEEQANPWRRAEIVVEKI